MSQFKEKTDKFLEWLSEESVSISSKVAVNDLRSKSQGRGMVAVEDIAEDETLFSIPRNVIINIDNCNLIKEKPDLREQLLSLNHWESLIIILLYELKVKKDESRWVHYFNTLPISDSDNYEFNQLMFWSDTELKNLYPSLILERVGKEEANDMFKKLFPIFVGSILGIQALENVTINEFHKVASLIMSYSFDVERVEFEDDEEEDEVTEEEDETTVLDDGYFKSMVPLADILNANTHLHNANLVYTPTSLVMKSTAIIKKGEQVYNTYSDHPNSEILRRYGYVEFGGSKFDFGEIPLRIIKEYFIINTKLSASRLDEIFTILNKIGDEEEDQITVVLESYDCFNNSEVILEFTFLIQVLTIISIIVTPDILESSSPESKSQLIKRVFKKCYQLLESNKLTNQFLVNYEQLIKIRMNEYPQSFKEANLTEVNRRSMANVVLKSEFESLSSCLDFDNVFKNERGMFKFIDDSKLIRNIEKKRSNEMSAVDKSSKKTKLD